MTKQNVSDRVTTNSQHGKSVIAIIYTYVYLAIKKPKQNETVTRAYSYLSSGRMSAETNICGHVVENSNIPKTPETLIRNTHVRTLPTHNNINMLIISSAISFV